MGSRLSAQAALLTHPAVVTAPANAPTITNQLTDSSIGGAYGLSGGLMHGAAGAVTYQWRCRFVTRYGYSAPGPATAGTSIALATTHVRLKSIPVSSDASVIGVLFERNTQASPSGWFPIYLDADSTYTVPYAAPQFDDNVPDANVGAALQAGDTTASATLQLLGAPTAAPTTGLTGDAAVQAPPTHPYAYWPAVINTGDGRTISVALPLYRRSY